MENLTPQEVVGLVFFFGCIVVSILAQLYYWYFGGRGDVDL